MTAALWQHFAAHHGIITRREAEKLGISPATISRRLRSGEWVRLAPSVFRHASAPPDWMGWARAAALSADGLASHRTAAALWEIDGFRSGPVEVTVDRARRIDRQGATIHQSTQMHLAEPTEIRGIPVTGIGRTVLDLGAVVGWRRVEQAIDSVLRRQLIDWPDLYNTLVRHSRQGRNGCGPLRRILEHRYGDKVIPDSRWNRMVAQLLVDAGLPEPVVEYEIRRQGVLVARVDLAYPRHRLALELDSLRYHLNRPAFESDARRRNRLLLAGWTGLSFTWADYSEHPTDLCRTVRRTLDRLAP
ncbi:MAG: hypothetical protein HKN26_01225 [Acidimicrobiales bacterium]|nr:hypothetical protein [Acidimicrobiales bacterium]